MKLQKRSEGVLRILGAAMAIAALIMTITASLLPWGSLDVKTKLGPIPVTLDADVYEYGINYEANLNGSQLPLGGGKIPSTIADKKVFLTGLGGFQETIGFIKGTTKDKNWTIESRTWPPPMNGVAKCNVTTFVKTIPWWPVGLAQDAGVTVELTNTTSVSEVIVQKVWFEVHRTINGEDRFKNVSVIAPGDSLKKVGDKRSFGVRITIDDDYGEFRLVGMVLLEVKDEYGHSNKDMDNSDLAEPRDIKLWTMGTDKTARIGMMMAAFPLSITSVILLGVGAVLGLFGGIRQRAGRWAWKVLLAGSIMALLAVVFYVLGIGALIELTGYSDWFSWNSQFYIAIAGACMSVVPAALLFIVRPPSPPKKTEAPNAPKGGPTDQKDTPAMKQAKGPAGAKAKEAPTKPPEPPTRLINDKI